MAVFFNRRIPDEAHDQIGALASRRIHVFAFTPSNGWVIVTEDGRLFARNIPQECFEKLQEFLSAGHKVRCVAFPSAGGNRWVIITDRSFFARNIPQECFEKMQEFRRRRDPATWVAFPPGRGNRWIVLARNRFFARNIDDECFQIVRNLSSGTRPVERVAFEPDGGWVVLAQDYFFTRNIDDECFGQMRSFDGDRWKIRNVAFSPQRAGWSLICNDRWRSRPRDRMREAEADVAGNSIWSEMRSRNIPGAAVAVVQNNRLAYSTGYGHLRRGHGAAAHPESVFQAASISKLINAVGVLRLAHTTALQLDDDVRPQLNWTLGKRNCLPSVGPVTFRSLLNHTGGVIGRGTTSPANRCSNFSAGGGGFAGYPTSARVPSLLQILNGSGPANSPKIELSHRPGTRSSYSGHGLTLIQRAIEVFTGQSYRSWFSANVLSQLGMNTSTFALGPPSSLAPSDQVADGHLSSGNRISGGRNRYPESAAAGLYTTPIDLAQVIIMLNQGGLYGRRRYLPSNLVTQMMTGAPVANNVGLGCFLAGSGVSTNYSHGGSNRGFRCTLIGYPRRRAGVVVMTNGSDDAFPGDVAAAIQRAFGW